MGLSDTQLIMLTEAAKRDDRAVVLPDRLKGGAAAKVVGKLLSGKLVEEIPAKGPMPIWRRDEDGSPVALRITQVGLKAINADDDTAGSTAGTAANTTEEDVWFKDYRPAKRWTEACGED